MKESVMMLQQEIDSLKSAKGKLADMEWELKDARDEYDKIKANYDVMIDDADTHPMPNPRS